MTRTICSNCRGSHVEYDAAQGNSFCADCGAVLEENVVVSEVTFAEMANGSSVLQGQFVSADKGRAAVPNIFGRRMGPLGGASATALSSVDAAGTGAGAGALLSESREVTLASGKRRLAAVATALGLGEHHVEMAHRWFTLALQHQFTRGRRSNNIIASCLYIVCRLERTPHMLLDFSDILQTSVYALGGTFLRLTQLLNLELPLVDPSFYIGRFAARLALAERTQGVVNSALRVAARMKRDWIVTGRRPAGVCAAALIVAARLHGFRRTERQVVRVVHICEATLRRRLAEFAATPSSQLSPEEFEGIWLEHECDPPSFALAKLRARPSPDADDALSEGSEDLSLAGHLESEILCEIIRVQRLPKSTDDSPDSLDTTQTTPAPFMHPTFMHSVLTPPYAENIPHAKPFSPISTPAPVDNLSDLDDDEEVHGMLLNDAEVDAKTTIWSELNGDFLEAQAEIERLERAAKLDPGDENNQNLPNAPLPSPIAKKPRKKRARADPSDSRRFTKTGITGEPIAESAAAAARQAFEAKKLSKKINYDALDALMTAHK